MSHCLSSAPFAVTWIPAASSRRGLGPGDGRPQTMPKAPEGNLRSLPIRRALLSAVGRFRRRAALHEGGAQAGGHHLAALVERLVLELHHAGLRA